MSGARHETGIRVDRLSEADPTSRQQNERKTAT